MYTTKEPRNDTADMENLMRQRLLRHSLLLVAFSFGVTRKRGGLGDVIEATPQSCREEKTSNKKREKKKREKKNYESCCSSPVLSITRGQRIAHAICRLRAISSPHAGRSNVSPRGEKERGPLFFIF
ncbi:hypothetical protein BHM03_00028075 [Ensete ventricosum]|nr:hypothetical protein BHM03_00028075 [Ensete ventricosum]